MIYDPIPFVKAGSKIFSWKLWAYCIMRICGKIFIFNLHNLQMLSMLWIKNKFSECLAPAQTWSPPVEDFLATVLSRPADTVGHSGAVTPKSFFSPKFGFAQKNLFQISDKKLLLSTLKMYFPPKR